MEFFENTFVDLCTVLLFSIPLNFGAFALQVGGSSSIIWLTFYIWSCRALFSYADFICVLPSGRVNLDRTSCSYHCLCSQQLTLEIFVEIDTIPRRTIMGLQVLSLVLSLTVRYIIFIEIIILVSLMSCSLVEITADLCSWNFRLSWLVSSCIDMIWFTHDWRTICQFWLGLWQLFPRRVGKMIIIDRRQL